MRMNMMVINEPCLCLCLCLTPLLSPPLFSLLSSLHIEDEAKV